MSKGVGGYWIVYIAAILGIACTAGCKPAAINGDIERYHSLGGAGGCGVRVNVDADADLWFYESRGLGLGRWRGRGLEAHAI